VRRTIGHRSDETCLQSSGSSWGCPRRVRTPFKPVAVEWWSVGLDSTYHLLGLREDTFGGCFVDQTASSEHLELVHVFPPPGRTVGFDDDVEREIHHLDPAFGPPIRLLEVDVRPELVAVF
jgi:hypothetical protein